MADQELRRRKHNFAYDLSVNVLAVLVAAALIYLGAVYGGYLAKNPDIVVVSIAVIMLALVGVIASVLGPLAERALPEPHQPTDKSPTR
jgi:uncharacterized membrane protein (DUF485 family)